MATSKTAIDDRPTKLFDVTVETVIGSVTDAPSSYNPTPTHAALRLIADHEVSSGPVKEPNEGERTYHLPTASGGRMDVIIAVTPNEQDER